MEYITVDMEYDPAYPINMTIYGDFHLGAISCARDKLKKHMDERAALPNSVFAMIGDFGDWIVTKSDKRYRADVASKHVRGRADIVNATLEECVEMMAPYKWAFVGMGNHEHSLLTHGGLDVLELLLKELGNPPNGYYTGYFKQRFIDGKGTGGASSFTTLYTHGVGSATAENWPPMRLLRWANSHLGFDAVASGHYHKKGVYWKPYVKPTSRGKLKHIDIPFVGVGTFNREETQGEYPGYGERAGYPPCSLGSPLWQLTPNRTTGITDVKIITGSC